MNLSVTALSRKRNSIRALIKSLASRSLLLSTILTAVLKDIKPGWLLINLRRSTVKTLKKPSL
jgi:Tfp pilus assembly protein PilN